MSCQKIVTGLGAELFNSAFENESVGAIKLGLSPQNNRELNLLTPERGDDTVSFKKKNGGCVPVVTFRHLSFNDEDDTVSTSPMCTATEIDFDTTEVEVEIAQYAERGFKISECTMNTLCPEDNDIHQKQVNDGRSFNSGGLVKGIHSEILNAKMIENVQKIVKAANKYALDAIVDGIGINPLYNSSAAQEVRLFTSSEEKGMTMHLDDEIRNLWREKGYFGRPIIATGSNDVVTWFNRMCNVGCCSAAGIDYSRVVASGYEVYFIKELRDELGPDEFLIMAPKTFIFLTVDRWRNVKKTLASDRIALSKMGYFAIKEPSVRSLDSTCFQEGAEPQMLFDLRVREVDCDGNNFAPSLQFFPSLTYDTFLRPEDSMGVTGIFRYRIKNYNTLPEIVYYVVSFNSNGGSVVSAIGELELGDTISAPSPAPTREGYTFGGWYKDSGLTQAWNFTTDEVTGDTTLYAKWTAA